MIKAIIGKVRELFFSSPQTPGIDQEKKILVYLFQQRDTDKSLYALWLDWENTNKLLTEPHIRNMLSKAQYRLFLQGEMIFEVPERKVKSYSVTPPQGEKSKWLTDPYDGKSKTNK